MRFLGPHACEEALTRGELRILRIAPTAWDRQARLRESAQAQGVVIHQEPAETLDRRAEGQRHNGVLGEGGQVVLSSLEELLRRVRARGASALVLALDGVTDPNNFGAILRTAAAAGVDGVIFPERRSAQVNETVVRASAGTAGQVPLVRVVNLGRALDELKDAGAWIYGLQAGAGSQSIFQESFDRATVLVMGSEGEGLRRLVADHCNELARIPLPGGFESLNVSAAAAVALYEASRPKGLG